MALGGGWASESQSYSHNKTSIIRDRSSMGKRISTLIQSSLNMNEGHITRETVNKGFQAQMKREKEGVLWGEEILIINRPSWSNQSPFPFPIPSNFESFSFLFGRETFPSFFSLFFHFLEK